jgi:CRP/FNR family transcriptional regulator, cyclic AMP receptor protein
MIANAASLRLAEEPLRLPGLPGFPTLVNVPHIEKTFWRGMTIYTYEDAATHLYFSLKGRVKILRASPEGQQKITSIRYPGEVFGELALAGNAVGGRRSDEAMALDTTRVALLRVSDFWHAIKNDPSAMQSAIQHLTARLSEAQQQIGALVFENNQRRLAQALLEQSAAARRTGEDSVRLTHEELAELIGSTREVVTGMMIEFRQHGLIDYKRGEVRPRTARLEQFLLEDLILQK